MLVNQKRTFVVRIHFYFELNMNVSLNLLKYVCWKIVMILKLLANFSNIFRFTYSLFFNLWYVKLYIVIVSFKFWEKTIFLFFFCKLQNKWFIPEQLVLKEFFLQHCFWILKAKNVTFLFYGLISVAYVA